MLQISEEKPTLPDVNKSITRYYNNRTVDKPYITAEFPAEEFKENFVVGGGTQTGNKRRKRAGEIYSYSYNYANYNCAHVINVLNHTGRFSKVKRILNVLNENNTLRYTNRNMKWSVYCQYG